MTAKRRKTSTKSRGKGILATLAIAAALVLFAPLLDYLGVNVDELIAMVWQPSVSQSYPSEGTAEVHFIDVGQASSILIKGSEKTALIDAGESGNAEQIVAYLEQNGVASIDYFFNTHPHSDHAGGCRGVMQGVPTANFIMTELAPDTVPTTVFYGKLLEYLNENKATTASTVAKPGDLYELGGGLRLEVIGPVELYDDLNDVSLVIRMSFGETSFIFTGDMEAKSQRDMLEQGVVTKTTVLSSPHHGSNSSIDAGFMQRVAPQYAVISCGTGNDYGHPHAETLELYKSMGIESYRTDLLGSVKMITDGQSIVVETERS